MVKNLYINRCENGRCQKWSPLSICLPQLPENNMAKPKKWHYRLGSFTSQPDRHTLSEVVPGLGPSWGRLRGRAKTGSRSVRYKSPASEPGMPKRAFPDPPASGPSFDPPREPGPPKWASWGSGPCFEPWLRSGKVESWKRSFPIWRSTLCFQESQKKRSNIGSRFYVFLWVFIYKEFIVK